MTGRKEESRSGYPLAEVALVTSFPPEASIECLRHEFFKKIRDVYSQLIPPEWHQDVPPAFEPYRFNSEDGSAAVVLGLASFGYVTSKYTGYGSFRKECLRLFQLAQATFGISTLSRIGLRYTNIMEFERIRGVVPMDKLLRVGIKLPKGFPFKLNNPALGFVVETQNAVMTVRVEPRVKQAQAPKMEEAIFLIISHDRTGQIPVASLPEHVDQARSEARDLYKWLTAESYRKSFHHDEEVG